MRIEHTLQDLEYELRKLRRAIDELKEELRQARRSPYEDHDLTIV